MTAHWHGTGVPDPFSDAFFAAGLVRARGAGIEALLPELLVRTADDIVRLRASTQKQKRPRPHGWLWKFTAVVDHKNLLNLQSYVRHNRRLI